MPPAPARCHRSTRRRRRPPRRRQPVPSVRPATGALPAASRTGCSSGCRRMPSAMTYLLPRGAIMAWERGRKRLGTSTGRGQVLGFSALETGVSYLPFSLTLIAVSAGSSRIVDRVTPRPVLVTGLLITTAGFIVLTQVSGHGDYLTHVLQALVILAIGLGMSFVPITIAATSGVAPEDSGLASGLLNTTQQVGGSVGLAILSTVSTTRIADALHEGAALPVALTHGFKGGFIVSAILCAASAALALALLLRRKRAVENEQAEAIATSFARCPGAPYCGHLARLRALGRRMRRATGHG